MQEHLIIFVKNPELGKVKTRIALGSDDLEALQIYKKLLAKTRDVTYDLHAEKHLFYSETIVVDDEWSTDKYHKYSQVAGDLGEKMLHAFKTCFTSYALHSEPIKVLIIGSDCPYITPEIITQAYCILDEKDIVIGPTFDGGYYLLGMKQVHPQLFRNIHWSTNAVFEETIDTISNLGCTVGLTPILRDIDTFDDWKIYEAGHM